MKILASFVSLRSPCEVVPNCLTVQRINKWHAKDKCQVWNCCVCAVQVSSGDKTFHHSKATPQQEALYLLLTLSSQHVTCKRTKISIKRGLNKFGHNIKLCIKPCMYVCM